MNPTSAQFLRKLYLLHSIVVGTGTNILQLIKEKFPDQSDRMEELYKTSEDFRSLCLDYFSCMEHLQKFAREAGEKNRSIQEYLSIRNDLEYELSQFLQRSRYQR